MKQTFIQFMVMLALSFFCLSGYASDNSEITMTLEEAVKKYSTPFIDNFRKRYEYNAYTQKIADISAWNACSGLYKSVTFKIPCTKQDIENMKELAKYGDEASLMLALSFTKNENLYMQYIKKAADNGNVQCAILYGEMVKTTDLLSWKIYLDKAKASGEMKSYTAILQYYSINKMSKEFCLVLDEGYKKFGFDFIVSGLLKHSQNSGFKRKRKPTLFDQFPQICFNKTAEKILSETNTYTSKLYQGYQYLNDENYKKAKVIFQEIYDKSDDINLKQNAGFCLGAMYYSGTAVKQDTKYGVRLMKNAVNLGYEMFYYIPEISIIPNDTVILKYKGTCDLLLIHETYERMKE